MRKTFITKAMLRTKNLKERGKTVLKGHKGSSEMVAVIILIIVVVVVAGVVFMPAITNYIQNVVMPALSDATKSLFSFGG